MEIEKPARKASDYDHLQNLSLVTDSFRGQAIRTPHVVALVCTDGRTLTYCELDELSDLLATNLQTRGIQPDHAIGVYMKKSIEYVISFLGILKAGREQCLITYMLINYGNVTHFGTYGKTIDDVLICLQPILITQ